MRAFVTSASTSGDISVQVRNVTQAFDMLSTEVTIDEGDLSSKTATTPAVIDPLNNQVEDGDQLSIDISDGGTDATGLGVALRFG